MRYTVALLLLILLCAPAFGMKINGGAEVLGTLLSDGLRNIGTVETFADADATPDVSTGIYWNTFTNTLTIIDFDGTPLAGQELYVFSQAAITFDCTAAGFDCGTTDIVTAAGDITYWIYDGTDWDLITYVDQTDDLGVDGGGGAGEANTLASPDVGTDLDLINSVPKTGTALNLVSVAAADFDLAANIISIDDATWAKDSELHTVFAPTDIDTDYADETVTSTWTINDIGLGDLTEIDLTVGNSSNYGMQKIGDAVFGRTSHTATDGAPSYNLDGAFVFQNTTGPVTGDIEFGFLDSSGLLRLGLPKSAIGNATYNPRCLLNAGPAIADSDVVTLAYWQGVGLFDNITCSTAANGADVGVQNSLEVEDTLFVDAITESTTDAGITLDADFVDIQNTASSQWMFNPAGNLAAASGAQRLFMANGGDEGSFASKFGQLVIYDTTTGTPGETTYRASYIRKETKNSATGTDSESYGLYAESFYEPQAASVNWTAAVGGIFSGIYYGHTHANTHIDNVEGGRFFASTTTGTTAVGTVSNLLAGHFYVQPSADNKTITNQSWMKLEDPTTLGTGSSITNSYGVWIEDLEGQGGTNNAAIYVESQATAAAADQGNAWFAGGSWNNGHVQLGAAHIWFDGTTLYGKVSAPTGATDGTDLMGGGTEINDHSAAVTWGATIVPDANITGGDERDEVLVAAAGGTDLTCAAGVCNVDSPVTSATTATTANAVASAVCATGLTYNAGNCDLTNDFGATIGASEVDADIATQAELDAREQQACKTIESLVAADDDVLMWIPRVNLTITAVSCQSSAAATVVLEDYGGTAIETIVCETDGAVAWDSTISGTATLVAGEVMRMDTTSESTPTWTMVCWEWTDD